MNRTHSEIVVPIEKSAHAPGNFNCRQAGIMLDVHQFSPVAVSRRRPTPSSTGLSITPTRSN